MTPPRPRRGRTSRRGPADRHHPAAGSLVRRASRAAAGRAAPRTPPAPPGKQGVFHVGGLTITLGGFIEGAGIFRSANETSDISSTFSGIPLGNTPQGHETELRFTARQSRFTALIEGEPDNVTKIAGYGEIDLQVPRQPRIRTKATAIHRGCGRPI